MKVYLYLKNKVLTFLIPQKVSGSFSFDENSEEDSKLINIEAKNQEWYIYSTTDVDVIANGKKVPELPLKEENYYILKRNNLEYLIYVTTIFDNSFTAYQYNQNINLVIGNSPQCNINYQSPVINGLVAKIYMQNNALLLDISNNIVYLNNEALTSTNTQNYIIYSGYQIEIYGLRIIFLNNFLLINNPRNMVKINLNSSNLSKYQLVLGEQPRNIQIKDRDLYNKQDYFSKAPRIRRLITTKEINLSPPPKPEGEEEMPLLLTIGPMLTMGMISIVMITNNIIRIATGQQTLLNSWPQLATSAAMLGTMLLWPVLT